MSKSRRLSETHWEPISTCEANRILRKYAGRKRWKLRNVVHTPPDFWANTAERTAREYWWRGEPMLRIQTYGVGPEPFGVVQSFIRKPNCTPSH